MFKFRAKKLDSDEWIESPNISVVKTELSVTYYLDNRIVIPESLSVTYTGLTDKNGNSIFASFEVDGKMSKGGDIIQFDDWNLKFTKATVYFQKDCFYADDKDPIGNVSLYYLIKNNRDIEITGKQWSENEN